MKRSLGSALLVLAALACLFTVSALADSQARIVRLSDVQGTVEIDRGTGQGYEKAFLNMPITQGAKLKTGDDGRAEIEFEDGSVLHIVPSTTLQFTELGLRDSGAKLSTVELQGGEIYVNFKGDKQDEFTVAFGREKARLTRSAHFRLRVDDTKATLAVLDGEVHVIAPAGEVKVSKKETATFDLAKNDQYKVAKGVDRDPFDSWDKEQSQYHQRYEASNSYTTPYGYGRSDLNYYGSFMNLPGYGLLWQPYFTGAGWDPYMDGAWMFYPGFGYSWVSAYPWGWTPYHYGSWLFVPQYGWMWQPGGSWVGWNRVPRVINPPRNYIPPRPPAMSGPRVVAVGRGPSSSTVLPGTRPGSRVELSGPTGGIGVPRGVSNLGRVNRDFEAHGQAQVGVPGGRRGAAMTGMPTAQPRMGGAGQDRAMGRIDRGESSGARVGAAPRMSAPSAPRSSPSPSRSTSTSAPPHK